MKYFKFLIIALLASANVQAQSNKTGDTTAAANLQLAAQKMGQLFIEKNYTEYVKYVHPKILSMLGGQDKMIDALKQSIKQTEDEGFTFKNVTIGQPSKIIYTTTDLEAVVPQILELKTKNGRLVSTSYLLSVSKDKGKTWYFIDTSGKTLAQMKSVFPSLSNQLVIPEKTKPLFYND